jgi:hypothetical protein
MHMAKILSKKINKKGKALPKQSTFAIIIKLGTQRVSQKMKSSFVGSPIC